MKKIDIHSHILPGLDDGAKGEKEALEMCRIAIADGITEVIATPHFHYRRGNADAEKVLKCKERLQGLLQNEGLSLQLYAGNELYYSHDLLQRINNKEVLTMANSDYVLLEFSPECEKRKIQNAIYEFINEGYYPIIAHVERCEAFWEFPAFLEEIIQMGAYAQMNAGSLSGNAGWRMKRFARAMLKQSRIHFIATDAHDGMRRIPAFGNVSEWIRKKYGDYTVENYLWRNPKMIIDNQVI